MEAPVELEDGPVRDAEGYMRVAMRYIYVATRYIRVRNGITSPILITSMSRNRCGSAEIDQDCSEIVARLCCFPESSFRVTDLPFLDAGPCLLWSLIANPVGSNWIHLSSLLLDARDS